MQSMNSELRRSRNGFVTIYVTFTCLILMPIVGLAIDFSVLYNVKARLQTAVDAAAVGSGTMLQASTDLNDITQVATIRDASQRFFNANYPSRYWGSTPLWYSSTASEDLSNVRTVYVKAGMSVPMLFMRVIGIRDSTVAAEAAVKVRFVSMMVVVDRSGSVVRGGADGAIRAALNQFITDPATSPFVDGRDVIGMVSFSGNSKLDLAPVVTFRSGASTFGSAVAGIPFSGNTNTSEGLYQGYNQLRTLNNTGALNVIVLLTDGRPSAFSSDHFQVSAGSTCTDASDKSGFIAAYVGADATQWPPPQVVPNGWGIRAYGVHATTWGGAAGEATMAANLGGCAMSADAMQMPLDITDFPPPTGTENSRTGPYYQGEGTRTDDPRAVRYAAFNAAYNMATTIRQDTTIRPVLFVIGLNEPPAAGEPLDADFLVRLANDPVYTDVNGISVYQQGQTPGKYYNVNSADLGAAFQDIASQILRLAQ